MTCPQCGKSCEERKIRQRRDGSTVILAKHIDGSPAHIFSEWPNFQAFINRKYPYDAKRRIKK